MNLSFLLNADRIYLLLWSQTSRPPWRMQSMNAATVISRRNPLTSGRLAITTQSEDLLYTGITHTPTTVVNKTDEKQLQNNMVLTHFLFFIMHASRAHDRRVCLLSYFQLWKFIYASCFTWVVAGYSYQSPSYTVFSRLYSVIAHSWYNAGLDWRPQCTRLSSCWPWSRTGPALMGRSSSTTTAG